MSDLMAREVVSVTETTPSAEVVALLAAHRITAMPVVDAGGLLVGVVTEADVLRVAIPEYELRGSTEGALPATVAGPDAALPDHGGAGLRPRHRG